MSDQHERTSQLQAIEQLTGVRSSKHTHYRAYRDKAQRLDRAIRSISTITAALANTTSGVPAVARAIAEATAQHFEADAALVFWPGHTQGCWLASHAEGGSTASEQPGVPERFAELVAAVQAAQQIVSHVRQDAMPLLGAPMIFSDHSVGVIGVASNLPIDEEELPVLETIARQATVAIESAQRYETSERLRAQTTQLYEAANQQRNELESKNRALDDITRQLQLARYHEIVNAERNRIARELHDSVAQHILSIGMNLEWCRVQLDPEDFVQAPIYERITMTKELARSAVARIRSAIFELSAIDTGQKGLYEALRLFAAEFERLTQIPVSIQRSGSAAPGSMQIEHALYRIAQEALFNAYKHANATHAEVALRFTRATLVMSIRDNGSGIAEHHLQALNDTRGNSGPGHYGLHNMRARAREIGGTCSFRRHPQGGTEVRVRVPRG